MKYVIVILLLLTTTNGFAQACAKEISDPEHLFYREYKLQAQRKAPATIKFPFNGIKIIDSRFDTTKLGFIPREVSLIHDKRNFFRKIRFQNSKSIAQPIEDYYNSYYQSSFVDNSLHLLIVMKRFWVSGVNNKRAKAIDLTYNDDAGDNLYCKWEYYLGNSQTGYVPFKRIDTNMQVDDDLKEYIDEDFSERRLGKFKFALKALIEINDYVTAVANYDAKPKKTLNEITAYNNKRLVMPVLNVNQVNKGVYFDFTSFKNNQPLHVNFKEKKMHYGVLKFEHFLADSADNVITNYWGYSDGTKFRIGKYGNDKIYRQGNTFQFFVQITLIVPNINTPVTTRNEFKVWVPYQLDMESGEIY